MGHVARPRWRGTTSASTSKNLLGPARKTHDPVAQREMDIAAALQQCFEDAMLRRLAYLKATYGIERICLAGGSALNVVMTGKLARSGLFKQTYVFPASGDDGASVGAAQYVHHQVLGHRSPGKALHTMSLGPSYSEPELVRALEMFDAKISYRRVDDIEEAVAAALAGGKVVGWFRGRMEFGPRALGNRSILADPRTAEMRDVVNARVKHREEFRPFAPAAIAEQAKTYFDMEGVEPFGFHGVRRAGNRDRPGAGTGGGPFRRIGADPNGVATGQQIVLEGDR